jgi:uncharacterized delta-60 repeat protein
MRQSLPDPGLAGRRSPVADVSPESAFTFFLQPGGFLMPLARIALVSFVPCLLLAAAAAAQDGYGDPTFDEDGIQIIGWSAGADPGEATAVAALADGSLLVGGYVEGANSNGDFAVVKLTPGGEVDTAWGTLGRIRVAIDGEPDGPDWLEDIAVLADGSILLGGFTQVPDALPKESFALPAVAKVTATGELALAFGNGGKKIVPLPWPTEDYSWSSAIHQPDGKLLFFGYCYDCPDNTGSARPMLLRLTLDGEPDPTFSGDGWFVPTTGAVSEFYPTRLALDGSGRILILYAGGAETALARLTSAGALDTSFGGGDGVVTWARPFGVSNPYSLAVDPANGAIYFGYHFAAGPFDDYGAVMRLTSAGAVDPAFGGDGEAEMVFDAQLWMNDIEVQSDGKIAGVGIIRSTAAGGDQDHFLFRMLANGTLDDTFHANGVRRVEFGQVPDGSEQAHAMTYSGGRLVAVGSVSVSGARRFGIARTTSALIFADGFERGSTASWAGN